MRRAILAVFTAAAGTSLLVGLKAHLAEPVAPAAAQAGAGARPGGTGPAGSAPAGTAPAGQAPGGNPPAGEAPPAGNAQTIDGKTFQTPYGPVAVTITVTGGKITDIDALVPSEGESAAISPPAATKLRRQALEKQTAKIDTVSGATYTSEAYKKSLQSAIDQIKRG